jgi:hypothetical protein
MRTHLATGLMIACAATLAAAAQTSAPAKKAASPKPITLSGCIVRGETTPGQYTLEDRKAGTTYRLTGTDVRDYVGRRVLIVGALGGKKFTIVGGLQPSANAAAQAGAIDPARAAMAAAGGSAGPGTVDFPEFRVKSVRPVSGSCPD